MCQPPYISVFPEDDFGMKYWSSFDWNKTFSICYTNNALTSCILLVFFTWILPIHLKKQNPAIIQTLGGTLWKTCAAEWLYAKVGTQGWNPKFYSLNNLCYSVTWQVVNSTFAMLQCFQSRRGKWMIYLAGTFITALWECRGFQEELCLTPIVPYFRLGSEFKSPSSELCLRGSDLGCFHKLKGLTPIFF